MPIRKKSKVALVKCENYDYEQVNGAVEKGIALLGGISNFTAKEEKIVIKPNVLIGVEPSKCVCTHPSVFRAVALVLINAGIIPSYGDSSGFGKSELNMKMARLKVEADNLGIKLADFEKGQVISHKEALLIKRHMIANGVLEADGLISLPKLKTHGLTRFTGAIKNQFGCVPGLNKSKFHVNLADPFDFATMLVDINTLIHPRLYIMDGIIAMEGNGPRSGDPKRLGVLLFSDDPVALDATACRIINLDPEYVPTSKPGEKAGLGTYHSEDIDTIGESIESFIDADFKVTRKPVIPISTGWLRTMLRNQISAKPVIDRATCTNCGECVSHCPVQPKSVDWHDSKNTSPPTFNYENCIRCYCCQELCPEGAIFLREGLLGRVFN